MAISRRSMILGGAATGTSALALAACGGSDSSSSSSTGGSGSDAGGSGSGEAVLANGTEPENPLVPTNTTEVGGGRVITELFAGLVYYTEKGEVEDDLAESIESEDSQNWTIKIKSGQKFSDGSAVTAQSFVDAWNFGALTTNAQNGQSFFDIFEGFDAVGAETPTAETLSGLAVVDDTTFTAKLTGPVSDFRMRLGYSAYMPLPESALKDMEAFGAKPVGNGPYVLDSWDHDQQIVLTKNPDYSGPRKAANDGLTFVIYADPDTMYNDLLSDGVDVADQIPTSHLSDFQSQLGDRAVNQPGAVIQTITIAQSDPNFSGEAGALRRKAISRAINREAICSSMFFDTRTPATDFAPPTIPGGGAKDIPGNEVLQYDEAKAKELWAQAEAIQAFTGPFTLSYNSDGPHKDWVEAVCNSIKNVLGIDAQPNPFPAFGEFRKQIKERKMTGASRSGWQCDYPSLYNCLQPLYSSAAADGKGSNDGDYKNPEVDQLLSEGLAAADEKTAQEKWLAAEAILMADLPAIPLWYQNAFGGHSTTVSDVTFGWDSVPLYYQVTKA